MSLSRAAGLVVAGSGLLLVTAACGSGQSASTNPGAGPDLSGLGGEAQEQCAGELLEAKRIPLDMYVMLDVSGSMLAVTEGDASLTKWQAVSSALAGFVSDDASAGIGVGLQLFPLRHPDAPASCTSNASCVVGANDFGPCFFKTCWAEPNLFQCDGPADCGGGECVPFGICANDDTFVCRNPGGDCGADMASGRPLGACVAPLAPCLLAGDCRAITYATPAVPISSLPGGRAALVSAITAAMPDPNGLTPSGPALAGAISQASSWAVAHPDHQVVAVLATDGVPTLLGRDQVCEFVTTQAEVDAVAQLAARGKAGTPSISTFVIGVVGPDDVGAADTLQSIAKAGGSTEAFIVDTRGDVQAQFRDALDKIRAAGLACELAMPVAEPGKSLDYGEVNVDFKDKSGASRVLLNVVDKAGCDTPATQGWYYDVDPAVGKPSRIVVCPATCTDFQATVMGSVQIKLGCKTQVVK